MTTKIRTTSLSEIGRLLGKHLSGDGPVHGFAVDTRQLKPGDLFFALPGAKVDGHSFLEEAAKRGAAGAVVHSSYHGADFGLPLIKSDDVLETLQELARKQVEFAQPRIVGITGSLGKTTTKEFVTTLLKAKYRVASSPGNSNSQIGLPLAILNHSREGNEIVVLEMGMTHPGQIRQLVSIAPPEVAVVTKVALVHACNFESIEEIARAKAEIFSHPLTKVGIYHKESDFGGMLGGSGKCCKRSFSLTGSDADLMLEETADGLTIIEKGGQATMMPTLQVPGRHNNHNFLAAVAVARHFGIGWEDIREAEKRLELPERRMQFVHKRGATFVNDAYNASELSMKAALESLPEPSIGRKRIAVLGGMVELGKFSEGCHRAVARHALGYVDDLFCFGEECLAMCEEWDKAGRKAVWTKDRAGIAAALKKAIKEGDVVLLKGSRSKEVNKVLEEI